MTASHDVPNETMMAWRVHAFGPPEVMSFEPVPRPEPGPGEVLVRRRSSAPCVSVEAPPQYSSCSPES